MSEHKTAIEFDTTIDEHGAIHLPEILQNALNKGTKVSVRVISTVLSKELKAKKIDEEEIERITSLQIEQRAQVVKFLLAEGTLAENKNFHRRAKLLMRV
jgi:hypothetical protein